MINSSSRPLLATELGQKLELSEKRVETILEGLVKDNLVQKSVEGFLPVHATFKTADQFGNKGLRNFYTYWLQRSVEAIDIAKDLRRFRSLQILLSPSEFEDLNNQFQEFVFNSLSRYKDNGLDERRLYLLNSSLFPVTDFR